MAGNVLRTLTSTLDPRRRTVLLLLAVATVAIASAGGPAADGSTWTGLPAWDVLSIALYVAFVAGIVAVLAALVALRHPGERAPGRRGSWQLLVGLLILAALSSLLPRNGEELAEIEPAPAPESEPQPSAPLTGAGRPVSATDLALLLAIVAGGLLVLWWLRRDEGASAFPADAADRPEDRLGAAVERASEQLFRVDRPRAAVLAAYRDLERALEELDLPRRATETPTEHLTRALDSLDLERPVDARPLLILADLYQIARFSEHHLTAADQRRAAEALREAHLRLTGIGA